MAAKQVQAGAPGPSGASSPGDLSRRRIRSLLVFGVLNLLAGGFYLLIAVRIGFFQHVAATIFSTPDSHSYREVAEWLFGGPNSIETLHRPFLYPLLLGVAQRIAGEWGIWALNLICWFGMLNLTSVAAWRMTGRLAAGAVVFVVMATNLSIIALTFQGLTESLVLLLEAAWVAGLAWSRLPPGRSRDFVMLFLPVTLLSVVKPAYQIEVVIGLVLLIVTLLRMQGRRLGAAVAVAACCLPIVAQLALNATANHFIGLSSTGELELKDYYFAQVYAEINGLPLDLTQARSDVAAMTSGQMLTYLLDHKQVAVGTLIENLRGNLTSPSPVIDPSANPTLWSLTQNTNRLYERLHVLFLPIVVVAVWLRRDPRLVLLYLFAALLILYPSLIYDQGDRYITMAMPFWSAAYVLAVVQLLSGFGVRPASFARRAS